MVARSYLARSLSFARTRPRQFQSVLQDFQQILHEHLELRGKGDELFTRKFYQVEQWDQPLYAKLAKQYDFHVGIVSDLMLELKG